MPSLLFSDDFFGPLSLKSTAQKILLLLFLNQTELFADRLYLWDIGQGSSASLVSQKRCIHFDLGGEKNPIEQIRKICGPKHNQLVLSHFDFDHYNFVQSIHKRLPLCILDAPKFPYQARKAKWFQNLKQCKSSPKKLRKLFHNPKAKTKNASSLVHMYDEKIIFTGDSGKKEEKFWSKLIPKNILWILSPHHGSNSSSSNELLARSEKAIFLMSSRKEKYGHPHLKVKQRFKNWKRKYLSTHDWGTIIIEFN